MKLILKFETVKLDIFVCDLYLAEFNDKVYRFGQVFIGIAYLVLSFLSLLVNRQVLLPLAVSG